MYWPPSPKGMAQLKRKYWPKCVQFVQHIRSAARVSECSFLFFLRIHQGQCWSSSGQVYAASSCNQRRRNL